VPYPDELYAVWMNSPPDLKRSAPGDAVDPDMESDDDDELEGEE